MGDYINFERTKFWVEQDVLCCEIHSNGSHRDIQTDILKGHIETIVDICHNQPMPFLIDTRNVKGTYIISSAKLLATSPELDKVRTAEVFVVDSMNINLLINSYKRIFNPNTPYRIFKNYDKAMAYCLEIKHNSYITEFDETEKEKEFA